MAIPWQDHIAWLKRWQAINGTERRPMKRENPTFNDWWQDVKRCYRRDVLKNPDLVHNPPERVKALIELGYGYDLLPNEFHVQQSGESPLQAVRGFNQCCQALLAMFATGKAPSLQSTDMRARQLACWLIRIQSGVLADNHVGVDEDSPKWAVVNEIVTAAKAVQSERQLALEWFSFCVALDYVIERRVRGDHWHEAVVKRDPALYNAIDPRTKQVHAALEGGGTEDVTVPSPVEMIGAINLALGSRQCGDRGVSYRHDRFITLRFLQRLQSIPLTISEWVRHCDIKSTGRHAFVEQD